MVTACPDRPESTSELRSRRMSFSTMLATLAWASMIRRALGSSETWSAGITSSNIPSTIDSISIGSSSNVSTR